MKQCYLAVIGYDTPERVITYSHLDVIASSEKEARRFIEEHLSERKPLGFTEAEIRKPNPKRRPWRVGLRLLYFLSTRPVEDGRKVGVVLENEEDCGFLF